MEEGIEGIADRTPESDRNGQGRHGGGDAVIGDRQRLIECALGQHTLGVAPVIGAAQEFDFQQHGLGTPAAVTQWPPSRRQPSGWYSQKPRRSRASLLRMTSSATRLKGGFGSRVTP